MSLVLWPRLTLAHEGHAALPTKGLTVQGDQLLLSEGARKAIDLQTEKVTLADMCRVVECYVHVELPWQQQAMITTQASGRIARVLVQPGDTVAARQELASIESLELESLQLAMLQADAELSLAQERFARQSGLAEQGVIAGKTALETEAAVRQRKAQLEVAMCKLRALGFSQSALGQVRQSRKPVTDFAIVSPIPGVIAEADVRIGQVVKTTEHLFHVVDLSTVWLRGNVLEGDVAQVQKGQPVVVRFKSLPGQEFSGVVDHLHLKMNGTRRTRAVAVALNNKERLLRPGMFGRMEIETERSREAIVCPPDGVIRYFGAEYVLVNRGEGKYLRRLVKVGLRSDQQIEIVDGLFPGDQVVVNGNHVLFSLFANETHTRKSATPPTTEEETPERRLTNSDVLVVQGAVEIPTDQKALASARIEGKIARILVNHSQAVRAGQVLAEVESLGLRNLQGELLEDLAKLTWTQERVERLKALAQRNIMSKKELWQLQTDKRVLENRVASVERRLTMLGIPEAEIARVRAADLSTDGCDLSLLRSIPIRAAIDGEVAELEVVPGQIVDAHDTLFEIHNRSTVWIKGYVFQRDASQVRPGRNVHVTFHALPGTRAPGSIVRVSPVLNANERVLPVWVEVDNQDGRLIEGMLARIEIGKDPLPVDATAPKKSLRK